jgi:hypothetical protein
MIDNVPPPFKRMCQNFGPDLDEYIFSWEDMVQYAHNGIDHSDARAIRPFLDELLSGRYSDEELKDFWWTMPVTAVFDARDMRPLLTRIREGLSRPPYSEAE